MTQQVRFTEGRALQAQWRACVNTACSALNACLYPSSLTLSEDLAFGLVRRGPDKHLLLLSENELRAAEFDGTSCDVPALKVPVQVKLCPLTSDNAAALRKHLPFTGPVALERGRSIGTGDRLGLATPGHIRAIRKSKLKPVLAQQSIREMMRTQRAPREVLDDATWGVLEAGYREGFAADADHLKTTEEIELTLNAGFTMYTVDPNDHVDGSAAHAATGVLVERFAALPWGALRCSADDCRRAYANRVFPVEGQGKAFRLVISGDDALRAAVKYGRAVAHTAEMYRFLGARVPRRHFAFEVAVDETDTPTTAAEHFYVASELRRLGVEWDGLAPRFVGNFYKGVDYVGDLAEFRKEFAQHVLIAQHFGGYKISLHSGSDKFSLYQMIAELAGDLIHIKTAGTSYLEALRVVAHAAPGLFRDILAFAKQRYPVDAVSYHVSADLARVADPDDLGDGELPGILDQPDTRQVCHVTFGSVLTSKAPDGRFRFRDQLLSVLKGNEETHYRLLEEHFLRHVSPFQ